MNSQELIQLRTRFQKVVANLTLNRSDGLYTNEDIAKAFDCAYDESFDAMLQDLYGYGNTKRSRDETISIVRFLVYTIKFGD